MSCDNSIYFAPSLTSVRIQTRQQSRGNLQNAVVPV